MKTADHNGNAPTSQHKRQIGGAGKLICLYPRNSNQHSAVRTAIQSNKALHRNLLRHIVIQTDFDFDARRTQRL